MISLIGWRAVAAEEGMALSIVADSPDVIMRVGFRRAPEPSIFKVRPKSTCVAEHWLARVFFRRARLASSGNFLVRERDRHQLHARSAVSLASLAPTTYSTHHYAAHSWRRCGGWNLLCTTHHGTHALKTSSVADALMTTLPSRSLIAGSHAEDDCHSVERSAASI